MSELGPLYTLPLVENIYQGGMRTLGIDKTPSRPTNAFQ
jgi:hypothetical protein